MQSEKFFKLLILSSSEGLPVAVAVQTALSSLGVESTVWNQHVFPHSELLLNSIIHAIPEYRDVVVVATPDDIVQVRGESKILPRDNILLEVGLSIGLLDLKHTHLLCPAKMEVHLPSDLHGLTYLTYEKRVDRNLVAAVTPPCVQLANVLRAQTERVMNWRVFGQAMLTLNAKVMRNEVHGGFRPSIVIGVNPGGALVGSVLYLMNRDRFYFTTLWTIQDARLFAPPPELQDLIRVASTKSRGILRVLLVDDSMKTGRNLRAAEEVVRRAAGRRKIVIKSAVVLYRPVNGVNTNSDRPDYYVDEEFTHLPYAEA